MEARLMFVHALSPLHAGTGQGVGVIDLPIAREKATGLPYLPGSSVKGTLRNACTDRALRKNIFGPDTNEASEHAGSIQFSDQRLLLLPVRSISGTFAWATSPFILRRLARDARDAKTNGLPGTEAVSSHESCLIPSPESQIAMGNQVILEDLDLVASTSEVAAAWGRWIGSHVFPNDDVWQTMLAQRFVLLHDDVLSFLLDTSTEVTARIRLDEDAKTVATGGALWYEEALPAETVLSGLVAATPIKSTAEEVFQAVWSIVGSPMQFGGKATVGRGLCRVMM